MFVISGGINKTDLTGKMADTSSLNEFPPSGLCLRDMTAEVVQHLVRILLGASLWRFSGQPAVDCGETQTTTERFIFNLAWERLGSPRRSCGEGRVGYDSPLRGRQRMDRRNRSITDFNDFN